MRLSRTIRAWTVRTLGLFSCSRRQRENHAFTEELDFHLQMYIEDLERQGIGREEARRQAILKLGGLELTQQQYRERKTIPLVDDVTHDLRFAVRQLRRNPGFALTATLMLALGIGASAAMFAFVDAALLRPLPYPEPARLASVTESVKLFGRANLSYPDYLDWKRRSSVFQSFDVYARGGGLLNTPSGATPVAGLRVTDGFFRTLGIVPAMGRDFRPGEDLAGTANVTILSHAGWLKWFAGRKDIVGQKAVLNSLPYTIIGVMPESFAFAPSGDTEFFLPFQAKGECDLRRSCHALIGIARLKDGVSMQVAKSQMDSIAAELEKEYPGDNRGQGAAVDSLAEIIVGDVKPILLTLLCGAGLLLLISCVNVSSLLLLRAEGRRKEIAVRGALGASHTRLIRQFSTEAALLVLVGTTIGIAIAEDTMRVLVGFVPKHMTEHLPFLRGLELNVHQLEFASLAALLALVLFAVTPLVRLKLNAMRDGMTEGSRGSGGTLWRKFGANLVVFELAIAVVLLVGAGLLGKSFYKLLHVKANFATDHIAMIDVVAPESLYAKDVDKVALQRQLLNHVAALPGVVAVGLTSTPPVSFNGNTDWIRFVGRPYNGVHIEVNLRDVSANYISMLQAKLIRGRPFSDSEDGSKPKVVIINKTLANMYFPGQDPIGQRFGNTNLDPKSLKEIIGVVDDIKEGSLDSAMWPAVYYPIYQDEDSYFTLMVRTSQSEASILPTLVSTIHAIDPGLGTVSPTTLDMRIQEGTTAYLHRSSAWLMGGFATLALVLGVVGLYGVIAYSVSQRTGEIGVRMALGAQRSAVYKLVMSEAGRLTALGIGVGLVLAVGAAKLMEKLLFGTAAWDALTLISVAFVLGIPALAASYIPARRAASVNPVEALRAE